MGQLEERYKAYREPQKFMALGVYPYFRAITSKQGTEVEMDGHKVLMFGSNAYTGLTGDQRVLDAAKATALATTSIPTFNFLRASSPKTNCLAIMFKSSGLLFSM